jgi:hypothetical protein
VRRPCDLLGKQPGSSERWGFLFSHSPAQASMILSNHDLLRRITLNLTEPSNSCPPKNHAFFPPRPLKRAYTVPLSRNQQNTLQHAFQEMLFPSRACLSCIRGGMKSPFYDKENALGFFVVYSYFPSLRAQARQGVSGIPSPLLSSNSRPSEGFGMVKKVVQLPDLYLSTFQILSILTKL